MAGLTVKKDLSAAVREAQVAFERYAVDRFPRAVQFALTGVSIETVNSFRREIPNVWNAHDRATRDGMRYVVDKDFLARVASVGEAKAEVFLLDLASTWLKFSFCEGKQTSLPGDVGVEAYFGDQNSIRVPVNANLRKTGLGTTGANGKVSGRDARRIAKLAAAGYTRNTAGATKASASWSVPEIKAGETSRQGGHYMGPGIYARPPRVVAAVGRKKIAIAVKAGRIEAPTTTSTRRSGTTVTVPRVVNSDVHRMLYLRTPQAEYQPVASPSWTWAMERAADTMADRLASELADRVDHLGLR